ncbi:MAG: hypothetical protein KBA55_01770 [Ruminococcus sp.]|nr:hypothetical protein [Ruminococcus sp.]
MKNILSNIWAKRALALISALYAAGVCRLAYLSIFYDIHIKSRPSLCLTLVAISLVALLCMVASRKQVLTKLSSFVILIAMLPVALLYFGEWCLIIPIVATGIIIFLLSGAGEGTKTAMGTVILLMYLFGAIGFFMFKAFFVASAKETLMDSGTSPSGKYRYEVVNTEDSSNGSTAVYVEPNFADVRYPFTRFSLKNIKRVVFQDRPMTDKVEVEWETQSRQEITKRLEHLSDNIEVELTEEELKTLGYTYDSKLMLDLTDMPTEDKFAIGKTAHDVDPVPLDELSTSQLDYFGIGKTPNGRYYLVNPDQELIDDLDDYEDGPVYFNLMDSKQRKRFYISKDRSVLLNSLTDAQLDTLGIADEGDVMKFNGKTVFRYYVAELDDYFDVDSRKLSFDLIK